MNVLPKLSGHGAGKILHPRDLSLGKSGSVRHHSDKTIRAYIAKSPAQPKPTVMPAPTSPVDTFPASNPSSPSSQDIGRFAEQDGEEVDFSDLSIKPSRDGMNDST